MAFPPKKKSKKKVAPKLQAVPRGAGGFAVKAPSVGAKPKGWLD